MEQAGSADSRSYELQCLQQDVDR